MPPQQTDVSLGIEGEAARRGPKLAIVSAKSAVDQALAARLKASAAALDDALSEKDAGPAAASTRGVLGLLKRAWLALLERRQNSRLTVQDLTDRELMDIGLTRGEVDYLSPQRAIDHLRDSTRHLWNRGGL